MTVFQMIEAQQKGKENTPAWMVGEQLKDICRDDARCAELVAEDLSNPEMAIDKCEKQINAYADKNKGKGSNSFCVIPTVAEDIIRKFYGLPARVVTPDQTPASATEEPPVLNMADFF